jgi:hypothetical protein
MTFTYSASFKYETDRALNNESYASLDLLLAKITKASLIYLKDC